VSSHRFKDKAGKNHLTELILTISNWHFVRDTQARRDGPTCKLEDCTISLKLSSTVFKTSEDDLGVEDKNHNFDKNGAVIPYSAFVSLMQQEDFITYLSQVRVKYESTEGSLRFSDDEDDDDDDDDVVVDDDAEVVVSENNDKREKPEKRDGEVLTKGRKKTKK
jgi:hypothetical protein